MAFTKKEKLEWIELGDLISKDKKLSKKQLDRFEWLKIKGYYYAELIRDFKLSLFFILYSLHIN